MLSIVVPMHNEADNVAPLVAEIATACAGFPDWELVLVDDGSTDGTAEAIHGLMTDRAWLRMVSHPTAGGQSAAVHSGVLAAKGDIVCTLDGDMQNPPAEIPKLVAPLMAETAPAMLGLVAGQRVRRQDTWSKRMASKFANRLRSWMLNDDTRDTGCGLKAFRRDAFLELPFFNHMHRYLPALFARAGYDIAHVDVAHRERGAGASKYTNFQRALVGIYDLFGVAWLIRRAKTVRPTEPARSAAGREAAE
ncbi:glycosyltransferase [Rhodobacterales bacterium HKCCE3408]|nr:glycosyltransferase [Rhodobacterales bacterium HKCCE3408]